MHRTRNHSIHLIGLILVSLVLFSNSANALVYEQSLNGLWHVGENRKYERLIPVPGLATNPGQMNRAPLWYQREVILPEGDWTHATLILKGARFCPQIYVNADSVSRQPGGMTFTRHELQHPAVKPGKKINLEIKLQSLKDMHLRDASRIPPADHWRSNISACLWDDMILRCHGPIVIQRVLPFPHLEADGVDFKIEARKLSEHLNDLQVQIELLDSSNITLTKAIKSITAHSAHLKTQIHLDLKDTIKRWSPETPALYQLKVTIMEKNRILDQITQNFGLREFQVDGLGFQLNQQPIKLRAGTVVWHRWVRDPEARELAWDTQWFEKNVIQRLKDHGANTLRFHLGMPPEALLNLCDQYGLMVQAEWSFFHGMDASEESLVKQWRDWLDVCLRHPCIVLIHPWNETENPRLEIAWQALDKILPAYPPLVLSHRDVIHIHKYWWSLFENLGLYYDSAEQFGKPVMVDEFGGNYLDGELNPGGYPTVKEAYLRFLGRGHTFQQRMEHHTLSNARVAEYWRRLDVAGFSPFTILGSPEDGNHWFIGPLQYGRPKPVWAALTAAWSPFSVSIDIWDRNFEPEQELELSVYFFNDTHDDQIMDVRVTVSLDAEAANVFDEKNIRKKVKSHQIEIENVKFKLPNAEGNWKIQALLVNSPLTVKHQVISEWDFRIMRARVPEQLEQIKVGIPDDAKELREFLQENQLRYCDFSDPEAQILLTSRHFWKQMLREPQQKAQITAALNRKVSVVLLDVGPLYLGQGYPNEKNQLGPLSAVRQVKAADTLKVTGLAGLELAFYEVAEPESHFHPYFDETGLWENLPRSATWLWNGLRGGLTVPATEMEISGLNQKAFIDSWVSRGADSSQFKSENYFAYELQGFFTFSNKANDQARMKALRQRVKFLSEDAVALQSSINPNAPIRITDLVTGYRRSARAGATALRPLANCGKNLTRTPVILIEFGPSKGNLILSQLLTAGRLAHRFGEKGQYGRRYDPAAVQVVLNMLNQARTIR